MTASKIRQDNVFLTEAIPTRSREYHRRCYQSYTNSKALMKFGGVPTKTIAIVLKYFLKLNTGTSEMYHMSLQKGK